MKAALRCGQRLPQATRRRPRPLVYGTPLLPWSKEVPTSIAGLFVHWLRDAREMMGNLSKVVNHGKGERHWRQIDSRPHWSAASVAWQICYTKRDFIRITRLGVYGGLGPRYSN